jgi:hypothetical protein
MLAPAVIVGVCLSLSSLKVTKKYKVKSGSEVLALPRQSAKKLGEDFNISALK